MNSSIEGLEQIELLLQCCPESPATDGVISPFPDNELSTMAKTSKQDSLWKEQYDEVKEILKKVGKIKESVDELLSDVDAFVTWNEVDLIKCSFDLLSQICEPLTKLEHQFQHPDTGEGSCLNDTVSYLRDNIRSKVDKFHQWLHTIHTTTTPGDPKGSGSEPQNFQDTLERLIEEMLLAIQALVKSEHCVESSEKSVDMEEEEEEDDEKFQEGLLSKHLSKELDKQLRFFNVSKVSVFTPTKI